MSTISTALRHFKEPTKEQLTEIFFSLPPLGSGESQSSGEDVDKMDINAVLSIADGVEDSYVCDSPFNYSIVSLTKTLPERPGSCI
jgi:TBC1 domain family member 8/9